MRITCFSNVLVLICLGSLFFFPPTVKASGCNTLLPCVAYSKANGVFIGVLKEIVKDKEMPDNIIYAHFKVEKIFKGDINENEVVKFVFRTSENKFEVGKKYFVYKDDNNPCNSTHLYSINDPDYIYADSLSQTVPTFNIGGRVESLSKDEIKNTKIIIRGDSFKKKISINEAGKFSQEIIKKGIYQIEILLPFDADAEVKYDILIYDADITRLNGQTVIKYNVEFSPNACDYREIELYRD